MPIKSKNVETKLSKELDESDEIELELDYDWAYRSGADNMKQHVNHYCENVFGPEHFKKKEKKKEDAPIEFIEISEEEDFEIDISDLED